MILDTYGVKQRCSRKIGYLEKLFCIVALLYLWPKPLKITCDGVSLKPTCRFLACNFTEKWVLSH